MDVKKRDEYIPNFQLLMNKRDYLIEKWWDLGGPAAQYRYALTLLEYAEGFRQDDLLGLKETYQLFKRLLRDRYEKTNDVGIPDFKYYEGETREHPPILPAIRWNWAKIGAVSEYSVHREGVVVGIFNDMGMRHWNEGLYHADVEKMRAPWELVVPIKITIRTRWGFTSEKHQPIVKSELTDQAVEKFADELMIISGDKWRIQISDLRKTRRKLVDKWNEYDLDEKLKKSLDFLGEIQDVTSSHIQDPYRSLYRAFAILAALLKYRHANNEIVGMPDFQVHQFAFGYDLLLPIIDWLDIEAHTNMRNPPFGSAAETGEVEIAMHVHDAVPHIGKTLVVTESMDTFIDALSEMITASKNTPDQPTRFDMMRHGFLYEYDAPTPYNPTESAFGEKPKRPSGFASFGPESGLGSFDFVSKRAPTRFGALGPSTTSPPQSSFGGPRVSIYSGDEL